jgi:hypothetical protein
MVTREYSTQNRLDIPATLPHLLQDDGQGRGSVRLSSPIEALARQKLQDGCPYAYYFQRLSLQFASGVLTVRGRLPTFYLKQMVQNRLRDIDGVREIDNQVDVVSATGLSGEPRDTPSMPNIHSRVQTWS